VLDYVKNSAVTMLNSFLQEEKIGKYRFDNRSYQSTRKGIVDFTSNCVCLFYAFLCRDSISIYENYNSALRNIEKFYKAQDFILESYKGGVFSSRHITRPEATHPLVIASSVAYYSAFDRSKTDVIVGLPAGSTELAFAHKLGQNILAGNKPDVLLFPVSFHSAKIEFDGQFNLESALRRWVSHHQQQLTSKSLLVVDDNSSTGRTIQAAVDSLAMAGPELLKVGIAEADVVRSDIDRANPDRPLIASEVSYIASVNVLPISRFIRPKTDLKEIIELRKMEECTKRRYLGSSNSFAEKVIGNIYVDVIRNPTDRILDELEPDGIIRRFQKTPLSNFAEVDVTLNQENFKSVEHAYQSMKFFSTIWSKVTDQDIEFINRKLEGGSDSITRESLPHTFSQPSLSPGNSKRVANHLRRLGHVRVDWDLVKVPIMIDLLIQKYADPSFFDKLQQTSGKYLIEGNTWNDTFWGECNGRGRNFLGRALMELRSHDISTLRGAADEIRGRLL
ncbi:NADAR domain-containing protein, partial [Pontixanthobacter sp.]|uniref:NADAR domain-containing protein n=1 Tax=Pontixanthobacter sp. TaxID=2792078 RepID=UPI003C7EB693